MLWAVTLKSSRIATERKKFHFYLQENDRGRFVRVTEDVNQRYSSIIVPLEAVPEFIKHLNAIATEPTPTALEGRPHGKNGNNGSSETRQLASRSFESGSHKVVPAAPLERSDDSRK
jgi:hypothetical protein